MVLDRAAQGNEPMIDKKFAQEFAQEWVSAWNAHDLDAIKAQERRDDLQGTNNVYITGGYARGAGLHEECWADGMEIAAQIKRVQEHDINPE